ncbi:hypothetical protein HMPREF1147_0481 [Selenomonas sp. FOBRC9]|nr:hypothetical protein HMPREF1147_0481 [Selenomonas sp. FOBRC9]
MSAALDKNEINVIISANNIEYAEGGVLFRDMPPVLYGLGIRKDLIEKPGHFRRGHATVLGSKFAEKRDVFAERRKCATFD